MLFVGGYSREVPKVYGPVEQKYCFACKKESNFVLLRIQSAFSLFFIPVLPFRVSYYLVCPYCGNRFQISAEQFHAYRRQSDQREQH